MCITFCKVFTLISYFLVLLVITTTCDTCETSCDNYCFPSAIRLWNCLQTDIATIDNFNEFSIKLQQHLLTI